MSTKPSYSGGKRNRYRHGMPRSERATKDLKAWLADAKQAFTGGARFQLVTYPDYPSKRTTIFKIAGALNARLSNIAATSTELVLYFHDATFKQFTDVPGLPAGVRVLNGDCTDISKFKVDRVHREVFGYATEVDPLTHTGPAVEKSDENAKHDGRIVQLPISEARPDTIYQVVIDNTVSDSEVVDYRVPLMGGALPLVYRKYKPHELRFTNEVSRSSLHAVEECFSEAEVEQIAAFTAAMNADFCELDVLRDNASGKLYIIDVNTTPYGPPAGLSADAHGKAVELLSEAFRSAFL